MSLDCLQLNLKCNKCNLWIKERVLKVLKGTIILQMRTDSHLRLRLDKSEYKMEKANKLMRTILTLIIRIRSSKRNHLIHKAKRDHNQQFNKKHRKLKELMNSIRLLDGCQIQLLPHILGNQLFIFMERGIRILL